MDILYWYFIDRMFEGDELRRNDKYGIIYVYYFYIKRNLWVLSCLYEKISSLFKIKSLVNKLKYIFILIFILIIKMLRYGDRIGNVFGILYILFLIKDLNVIEFIKRKFWGLKGIILLINSIFKCFNNNLFFIIIINSSGNLNIIFLNFIDYIFIDLLYGDNFMYLEFNFIWEVWLRVFINNKIEVIINKV